MTARAASERTLGQDFRRDRGGVRLAAHDAPCAHGHAFAPRLPVAPVFVAVWSGETSSVAVQNVNTPNA
jgi:hypothetical protein